MYFSFNCHCHDIVLVSIFKAVTLFTTLKLILYYLIAICNYNPLNLDNELVKLAADHGNLEMLEYLFNESGEKGSWGKKINYSIFII